MSLKNTFQNTIFRHLHHLPGLRIAVPSQVTLAHEIIQRTVVGAEQKGGSTLEDNFIS